MQIMVIASIKKVTEHCRRDGYWYMIGGRKGQLGVSGFPMYGLETSDDLWGTVRRIINIFNRDLQSNSHLK